MTNTTHATARGLADDHFAGRIEPSREKLLRAHLTQCASCRAYYERHLLLARLDPQATPARERLARGLGLAPRRAPFFFRAAPLALAFAGAALTLLCFLFFTPPRADGASEFAARGGPAAANPKLLVYTVRQNEQSQRPDKTIQSTDALAFAYANPGGFKHLLVFGVDEHGHVYWYFPEWSNATTDPRAIEIGVAADARELPEAINHELDGRKLTIYGIFLDEQPSVRRIERLVAERAAPNAPLPLPGAYQEQLEFSVEQSNGGH
jgi:hypothetical protein